MAMTFVKEEALERPSACGDDLDHVSAPLIVGPAGRKYNMQYSSLYDFRLKRLKHPKGRLLALAHQRWAIEQDEEQSERQASGSGVSGASYVRRILDVQQGAICFVIGTIYCSMHLKPDVLEELTREVRRHWSPSCKADSYPAIFTTATCLCLIRGSRLGRILRGGREWTSTTCGGLDCT